MKKTGILLSAMFFALSAMAQGYQIGDVAEDFRLLNVDGRYVSMADFPDAKGFIVIFSCNHCPYVVAYEDRMIELHNEFAPKGFPVIAINPNDSIAQPQDSYSRMIVRAREKNFPFPYLLDADQSIYPKFGATRTPHVFLLRRDGANLRVAYIGAIDDNYQDATAVQERFLANAIHAVKNGKTPDPAVTRAIGCTIKTR
ncbi:MAG: thioredoxin family protein [Bacteroidales bacterium]